MGFIRANIIPILDHHARAALGGKLLCLGYPDVYVTEAVFRDLALRAGRAASRISMRPSPKTHLAQKSYPDGRDMFMALGFSAVHVLDASPFEGADMLWDLNDPDLPLAWHGQFDVVIDHGTMEHVFHTPHFLTNIHRFLRIGGRVVHSAPAHNFVDHGFYQFSPTFFADYYGANGWKTHMHKIVRFTREQETEPPFFADYDPATFQALNYGGFDSKIYANIFIAEKTATSTCGVIPQQGHYQRLPEWTKDPASSGPGGP